MVFVELPIFIRSADDLFSDEDLIELQKTLLENPGVGDLIQGGRGCASCAFRYPVGVNVAVLGSSITIG